MTIYNVVIDDPREEAGITAARLAYNAWGEGTPAVIETNQEYVQFVMQRAAQSYIVQHGVP